MKRDILFLGMDIVKEMDKVKELLTTDNIPKEFENGYLFAKYILNELINKPIENKEETCIVHIKDFNNGQEEFFKSDLFKYLDKHDGFLPDVRG